jgi:excisionase family DNA binding protein
MKITYDPEVDALYISFSNGSRDKQQPITDEMTLDLSADGSVLGVEILDATQNYGHDILDLNFSLLGEISKPKYSDYTTEEAAEILRINKETVLRKIRAGELKASRIGKSYRISHSELKRLTST